MNVNQSIFSSARERYSSDAGTLFYDIYLGRSLHSPTRSSADSPSSPCDEYGNSLGLMRSKDFQLQKKPELATKLKQLFCCCFPKNKERSNSEFSDL
jgi:hypothetical protein